MNENEKTVKYGLTHEEWVELGKELEKWAITGGVWKWGIKESTKPVDMYIKGRFGIVKKVNYKDIDFLENKLAYMTVSCITNFGNPVCLKEADYPLILDRAMNIERMAWACPHCNLEDFYETKRTNQPEYDSLIRLCNKYLKKIGIETYIK